MHTHFVADSKTENYSLLLFFGKNDDATGWVKFKLQQNLKIPFYKSVIVNSTMCMNDIFEQAYLGRLVWI